MVEHRGGQAVCLEHRDVLRLQVLVGDVVDLVLVGLGVFLERLVLAVDGL